MSFAVTATVVGIGSTVATLSAQNKAQKKAKGENEAIERQNKVNEIISVTSTTIPTGSKEFLAFYDFAVANPEGVQAVQEKSQEAIKQYNERIETEKKQYSQSSGGDVSALGLPTIANQSGNENQSGNANAGILADLSILNNKLDSINPAQRTPQKDYTPLIIAGMAGIAGIALISKRN